MRSTLHARSCPHTLVDEVLLLGASTLGPTGTAVGAGRRCYGAQLVADLVLMDPAFTRSA